MGTSGQDIIRLGPGREEAYAFAGDDFITITSLSAPDLDFRGEVYDGGEGIDQLNLGGYGGIYDLRFSRLNSIESLFLPTALYAAPTRLLMFADQVSSIESFQMGGFENMLEVHMGSSSFFSVSPSIKFAAFFIFSSKVRIIGDETNETIIGGGGSDEIFGGSGNDILGEYVRYFAPANGFKSDSIFGGAGSDILIDGVHDDIIDGGDGVDEIQFVQDFSEIRSINVSLSNTNRQFTGQGFDQILNIENVRTGLGNDTLAGSSGSNRLESDGGNDQVFGGVGADTIRAGVGNDRLFGGWGHDLMGGGPGDDVVQGDRGSDTLWGGLGSDVFVFSGLMGQGQIDQFVDFNSANDTIYLDSRLFTGLPVGPLMEGALQQNITGTARDWNDRLILEIDTGHLLYDVDGVGPASSVHFATIPAYSIVISSDFVVI